MDQAVLTQERQYLGQVKEALTLEMETIDRRFEQGVEAADELTEESVRAMLEGRYRRLLRSRGAPYFARIDFREAKGDDNNLYLGKAAVYDGEGGLMVADWRAPVANLYYESRLGPCSYQCPEGEIQGELQLKRRFTMADGQLESYDDIDVTASDELLSPYLSVSADEKLKSIIATIQSEQNRVIRAPMGKPLIVQGVAGSGKTTVALHRVAYLIYTYARSFRPDQVMVLSSGGFFLSYIAGVLPDLGVEDVAQCSFEELVEGFVKAKLRITDPAERLFFADDDEKLSFETVCAYKCSPKIYDDIDAFVSDIAAEYCPEEDFTYHGEVILGRSEVLALMQKTDERLSVSERLDLLRAKLSSAANHGTDARAAVKAYFSKLRFPKVAALYQRFLSTLPEELQGSFRRKKGFMEYEDLAPLLWLRCRLQGAREAKLRHIVIDEAQDFSAGQLRVLTKVYPKATFTILGDLAQAIYGHRGTEDWDALNRDVWNGEAELIQLTKTYRTTVEIMEAANEVLRRIPGMAAGEAVIRHGEPVAYVPVWGVQDRCDACAAAITHYRKAGHKNIAVILRGGLDRKGFYNALSKALPEWDIGNITGRDDAYKGGLCLLDAAMAKGLEFDAVIVADAERYSNSPAELRLLYVAMTRAMHALTVLNEEG